MPGKGTKTHNIKVALETDNVLSGAKLANNTKTKQRATSHR